MAYDELSRPISVTEASRLIKGVLEESFYQIVIRGEVTNYRPSPSGHAYFNLSDEESTLSSIVFRSCLVSCPPFQNGDLVVAVGRLSYYEKGGKLSFIINRMMKEGDGMLQAMIEKRKMYYQNLGWFDPQYKKPLPDSIRTIGVVTSATGAVIHDILNVTRRRAPGVDIILFPCAVQGKGAEVTIASRIRQANNFDACDVLIVGRGGGSIEDLAPFSEDEVIVAIHDSHIPVISAVGHESDWSLSDYVADVRAGTPSIAAEKATERIWELRTTLSDQMDKVSILMRKKILEAERRIPSTETLGMILGSKVQEAKRTIGLLEDAEVILGRKCENALFRLSMAQEGLEDTMERKAQDARRRIALAERDMASTLPSMVKDARDRIKSAKKEIALVFSSRVGIRREEVKRVRKEVEALSPLAVLSRGYAVVMDKDGKVLKSEKDANDGDNISIRLYSGELKARVTKEKE